MSIAVHLFDYENSNSSELLKSVASRWGLRVSIHSAPLVTTGITNSDPTIFFINAQWLAVQPDVESFLDALRSHEGKHIIYDWDDSKQCGNILSAFLPGASISKNTSSSVQWSNNEFCLSLAGHTADYASCAYVFKCDVNIDTILMSIDSYPSLIATSFGSSTVFLMAGLNLSELELFSNSDIQEEFYLVTISPILLFLRNFLLEYTWHTETDMRCFILDDPPLRKSYGFVNYYKLSEAVETTGSVSISFIPWYFAKSDGEITEMISKRYPALSLCIHGCDHIWNEFCCSTQDSALVLLQESMRRMKFLSEKNNVSFDKVIVFPQGRFSLLALKALAESEITGAINTTLFSHGDALEILSVNLISPVLIRFGFPMFRRRYPSDAVGFALDRLLGRPFIYAEHHTFFRDGYSKLTKLFEQGKNVQWSSPEDIITRYYQTKSNGDGRISIRFFSSDFSYTHIQESSIIYFETRATGGSPIGVSIDGENVPFEHQNGTISFSRNVSNGITIHVVIEKLVESVVGKYNKSWKQRLRIHQRRNLSEIRDNYISKYKPIERVYEFVRGILKQ